MAKYVNVSGELTQELVSPNNTLRGSKISLTNIHADTACFVDLYIHNQNQGSFYLLKKVELPVGATLIYNEFSTAKYPGFALFIKLTKSASETPVVDVIIS
tara:strand:+ start:824 stop:1126 length:303 start_codon:yes stop_codon:yes gene_type:complete